VRGDGYCGWCELRWRGGGEMWTARHPNSITSHIKSHPVGASRSGCVSRPYTACINGPKILDGVSSNCTALRYARYPRGPFQLRAIGQVVLPQDDATHVGKA
jgi:hypothetical protein